MSFARIGSTTIWQTVIEVGYFRAKTHFREYQKKKYEFIIPAII